MLAERAADRGPISTVYPAPKEGRKEGRKEGERVISEESRPDTATPARTLGRGRREAGGKRLALFPVVWKDRRRR